MREMDELISDERRRKRGSDTVYESLNYDVVDSKLNRDFAFSMTASLLRRIDLMRWVVTLFIGAVTAIIAFLLDISIKYVTKFKFSLINNSTTFQIPFFN